ncbi:sulfatase [Haloferula sp. A504]|uniref:sulfatase n=1 Tax=Haloferula sp. A504 TaxID=3373601 RepID=UPI0031C6D036|nr:sulfatase [Verrucomicrobiaceae bacterium E54]
MIFLRLLAAIFCFCAPLAAADKPNVLFIAVDDLNDWVGYLGGHPQARTPHIDALARKGVAFQHAYCPAPVCGPSRTALMYGMAPHKSGSYGHHEIYSPAKRLPESQMPLNEVFQKNGYYTAGCGKIFHYREVERGWNEFRYQFSGFKTEIRKVGILDYGVQETDNDSDTADGKLVDWTIAQLQLEHDKPFFIAMGLRKPHLPWTAPRRYYEQIELEKVQLPPCPEDELADIPEAGKTFAHNMVGFHKKNDHAAILEDGIEGWRQLVHAYLATCSFADANVGRLLEALEQSPHRDNTIVVLWGDHGWHLGEKEHWRKMALWERSTRTPFIIAAPDMKAASIEAPVSLLDIFPTLVELCGLECGQPLDGNSLVPLLTGADKDWDKPVTISHGPGNFAIRQGPWRLIRYADSSEELYNIQEDPKEFTNLAAVPGHEATLNALREQLPKTWAHVIGPRFKNFPGAFAAPQATQE